MDIYNRQVIGVQLLNLQMLPGASNAITAQNLGSLNLQNLADNNQITYHRAKTLHWTPDQRDEVLANDATRKIGKVSGDFVETYHFGKFLTLI